jgi:hypothetical protein
MIDNRTTTDYMNATNNRLPRSASQTKLETKGIYQHGHVWSLSVRTKADGKDAASVSQTWVCKRRCCRCITCIHLQAILLTARAGEEMQLAENRKNLLLCVLDGVDGNGIELVLPKRFPLKPFPLYLDFLDQFQVGCTWNGSVISLARFCTTWIVATNLT